MSEFTLILWIFQSTHSMRSATVITTLLAKDIYYFNPRTPCGVRHHAAQCLLDFKWHFNPRTPCGVRRGYYDVKADAQKISIHALHAECDPEQPGRDDDEHRFQSTHSMRSATRVPKPITASRPISIHALHAECDL